MTHRPALAAAPDVGASWWWIWTAVPRVARRRARWWWLSGVSGAPQPPWS